ncbi:MAG: hypothetical protein E6X86_01805 [Clostridium butyricum]|nr:hypothetical protein [Clostridium butyricum]MDU4853690.1 hypothetical protein [Clostridioides difficile]
MISDLSISYNEDSNIVDKILSIIYMGMIAEERKQYTKLGKRIKRLGVYKLLVEDVDEAANCMRGMKWQDINNECIEAGF